MVKTARLEGPFDPESLLPSKKYKSPVFANHSTRATVAADGQTRTSVTALLQADRDGGPEVLDQIVPLIYDELRVMAHRHLALEHQNGTLHTTALVHEAYLRLADQTQVTARGRAYFFAAAAQAMRRVLVDRARKRNAQKRGSGQAPLSLDGHEVAVDGFAAELLDLDRALNRLAALDARQARVVECRFFGGMTIEETAQALDVSPRTVRNDWMVARAWLYHTLKHVPNA